MTQTDLTGGTLGGYRILRKLGQGGMAVVYKAHEESLNRVVALKVIAQHLSDNEQFITRFKREAQAAAQLSHPNIVQIYAIGEDGGVHFFAMEYVKGRSLGEIIEEEGFLTAGRAVPIIAQAAEALAVAHDAGIVHRDIKPANIMLDASGRVKVADFGIAQMATETRMTQSGMLVGTPEFISPEQCHNERLDGRSDIYSLGVTFYQLLSGRTPFEADTPASLVLQIVDGPIPPVGQLNPTIPAGVQAIVAKMMDVDRNKRFQGAEDLIHALETVSTQPNTAATQPLPAPAMAAYAPPEPTAVELGAGEPTTIASGVAGTTGGASGVTETTGGASEVAGTTGSASGVAGTTGSAPGVAESMDIGLGAAEPMPATVVEPLTAATQMGSGHAAETPQPSSPAAEAYAGGKKNSRGALLGLAAMVLIAVTVAIVAWQFLGDSSAADRFDPTTEARPLALPKPQEKAVDDEVASTASAPEGGADEAALAAAEPGDTRAAGTDNLPPVDADAGSAAAPQPVEARSQAAGAGPTTDVGVQAAGADQAGNVGVQAAGADQAGNVGVQQSAMQQQPPPPASAAAAAETDATPALAMPPVNSIVAETSGEYEYVDQVNAWVESAFGGQGFEIIDYVSSPRGSLQEAARFQVITTAKLVSTQQLEYFGNSQTQYTVALIARVTDLATGVTVVGPETKTIQYTSINMQRNLETGTNELARSMARRLRQAIRIP